MVSKKLPLYFTIINVLTNCLDGGFLKWEEIFVNTSIIKTYNLLLLRIIH